MASLTNRLGLKRPGTGDGFLTQDFYDNFTLLDGYPGIFICTSGSRPSTWGASQNGMMIFETDTALMWRWNGTAFLRYRPHGILGTAEITTDFSTALTTPQTAISAAVTVPATHATSTTKRIEIIGSWYSIDNGTSTTLGAAEVAILRDPGAVVIRTMQVIGRPSTATSQLDWSQGGTIVTYDDPGVAGGAFTYRLCINSQSAVGGTTTMRATANGKAILIVKESGV